MLPCLMSCSVAFTGTFEAENTRVEEVLRNIYRNLHEKTQQQWLTATRPWDGALESGLTTFERARTASAMTAAKCRPRFHTTRGRRRRRRRAAGKGGAGVVSRTGSKSQDAQSPPLWGDDERQEGLDL